MIHRKNPRKQGYDYSQPGYYFITANVKNRECVFGEIKNGKMVLNEWGEIASKCWESIPDHFPCCKIDEFVIMPDHVHGILEIIQYTVGVDFPVGVNHAVGVADLRPLQINRSKMIIPKIIHEYKSSVSRKIHNTGNRDFAWQRSFHDRIIRDMDELNRIRYYIQQNPVQWSAM